MMLRFGLETMRIRLTMTYRIVRRAVVACAALVLGGCASVDLFSFGGIKEQDNTRAPAGATAYQCDAGKRLFVRYLDGGATAWVILPGREFRLRRDSAGADTRYSNANSVLELKDQIATLREGTSTFYADCKAAAG